MGTPTNTIIIHTQSREARHLLDQHARLWKKLLPCSDDSGKHRGKRLIDIADAEQWRQSERDFHISDRVNERQFTIKGKGKTLVRALDKLSRQLCQSEPDAIIRRDCVGARQRSVSTSCHWQGRHYSERIREDDDHPTPPKWLAAPPQRERGHCVVSTGWQSTDCEVIEGSDACVVYKRYGLVCPYFA
jgi:hypothetical protein